jgi:hypothetical protein
MFIDVSQFPIVWIYARPEDAGIPAPAAQTFEEAFAILDLVFARETPFVFVGMGFEDDRKRRDPADVKRMNAWRKANRQRLASCRSMIVVETNAAKRLAVQAFGFAFEKYWGYPMRVVATIEDAMTLSGRLLGGRSAALGVQSASAANAAATASAPGSGTPDRCSSVT